MTLPNDRPTSLAPPQGQQQGRQLSWRHLQVSWDHLYFYGAEVGHRLHIQELLGQEHQERNAHTKSQQTSEFNAQEGWTLARQLPRPHCYHQLATLSQLLDASHFCILEVADIPTSKELDETSATPKPPLDRQIPFQTPSKASTIGVRLRTFAPKTFRSLVANRSF